MTCLNIGMSYTDGKLLIGSRTYGEICSLFANFHTCYSDSLDDHIRWLSDHTVWQHTCKYPFELINGHFYSFLCCNDKFRTYPGIFATSQYRLPLRLDTTILQVIKLLQIKSENGIKSFQGYLRNKILRKSWRTLTK